VLWPSISTREVETANLLLPNCSGALVEAVADKNDVCKDKTDCHTCNKCKYIALLKYGGESSI
jgi:hypothetical protein